MYLQNMSRHSFIKAARSFSESLSRIPQDNLPQDLLSEATQILKSMRNDPGKITFGSQEGQPFLPFESNLSLGLSTVWQHRWNRQNPSKALWIDTYMTSDKPSKNLNRAFDYEKERDRFIATHMTDFLQKQKKEIPDDLRAYVGLRRGGSIEGE
jgi:hypothetical protein